MCLSTVVTADRQTVCKNVASVTQKDGKLVFTDIMGIPRWWRVPLRKST